MTELCEHVEAWRDRRPQATVKALCAAVQLPRGTFYAWSQRQRQPHPDRRHQAPGRAPRGYSVTREGTKIPDGQILNWIVEILETDNPQYGYHKITGVLHRRYRVVISFKKVYRLLKSMALLWPQRRRKPQHPRRLARNWVVTRPNQLWETDITYGYIAGEDRFFYLQAILDVCDRQIIAYHIGLSCRAVDAARTLSQAVDRRRPEWGSESPVIRTDNGPQFTAHTFEVRCEELGVDHERIPVATPNMNAHIESWHAQLDRECLAQEFTTFAEAYYAVSQWIQDYNERQLHGNFWSPVEMAARVAARLDHRTPVRV